MVSVRCLAGLVAVLLVLCVPQDASASRPSITRLKNFGNGWDKYPQGQAERLIKALNLLPGEAEGLLEGENEDNGSRLLEKRLHLNIKGNSTVSTEELGQYAGYFKLARTHAARMFYFFFESRGDRTKDPLLLWMTGGPGCGSELALFYENGPFKITDDLTLVWNDFGWDKVSSILFVDQPIGTGFSYSTDKRDIRHDEQGVSEDMYDFFQAFFDAHPQYVKNDLFISGESYAGHYVPAVTRRLYEAIKKEDAPINLKGFAIGNGLTQPDIQYEAYADYALDMGIIDNTLYSKLNKVYPACRAALKLCGTDGTISCLAAYYICTSIFSSIVAACGNINYYDIRKECIGPLCYDFSNMDNFLNQPDTREALGVGNRKFVSCSPVVYQAMLVDWMRNLETGIPEMLENGIKLLVYAGEYDLICNWLGNSRWVSAMDWSGQVEYAKAPWKSFVVNDKDVGEVTSHGPLNFLKVYDAGHMVPMDQPKNSLEMIRRWTRGIPLDDESDNGSAEIVNKVARDVHSQ
eukprot:TRINITY_DN2826_c0_g1_i1.p1 TRINITY_DN2826_c0_g1~~TRINITY_DN2826_c0_g1_i1.p1  ORF type:complete len:520 (+),score=92.07 TRINITY_DN2826_c0_g1_i1:211-1770(+)